jgi:AraC-like DNA-binding protein
MQHKKYFTLTDPISGEKDFILHTFSGNCSSLQEVSRFHYVVLVTNGTGILEWELQEYRFTAPCLFYFSPLQPFDVSSGENLEGLVIQFTKESTAFQFTNPDSAAVQGVLGAKNPFPIVGLNEKEFEFSKMLFLTFQYEFEWFEEANREVIFSQVRTILLHTTRLMHQQHLSTHSVQSSPKEYATLKQLKDLIDIHYKAHKRPVDYAQMLNLSPGALQKQLKKHLNISLSNLIGERILYQARKELTLTQKSVKEIAFELGYTDQFYFSRFFKRLTGVSPEAYRHSISRFSEKTTRAL